MADLFNEGRYAEAAAAYDDAIATRNLPLEAGLLRARVHLRTPGETHKALSILNELRVSKDGKDFVRKEMLLGESYAVTRDFEAADRHLESARCAANGIADSELIADVAFRIGRRYAVAANAPERAREALSAARGGNSFESRLNAMHLESWILSREGRVRDQARVLCEILGLVDPGSSKHMEHRARASQTLAALARETFLPEVAPLVERHLGGTPWPQAFQIARFQTTKALAWAKALQGDYFNAFRLLKQSAAAAPESGWRTMVLCDRAYLAQSRGEDLWFRQELSDAEEAAESTNWEGGQDESRVALLLLAELCAPHNAAQASAYLARFRSLGDQRNVRSLMRDDERFGALVDYSTGVVDTYLGERKLAASRFQRALAVYERAGFEWRAARCALRLFDATKKSTFLELAEERLRHYSESWLAEELRKRRASNPDSTLLTPMRDKVFRLLCDGKSNVEMAMLLHIKVPTVANHAKAVLKTFGVNSRHALVAEAMKRKLI